MVLSSFNILKGFKTKMAENTTTKENPISVRPLHDRLRSVNEKRPTRPLPNLINYSETKAEKIYPKFLHFSV
jgi:hypothetical protein